MSKVFLEGQIISRVSMTPLSGNNNGMTFRALAESSRVDGTRHGGAQYYWLSEGAEKTASELSFNKIELKLNKIAALVYATDELIADTTALESEIMSVVPRELRFGVQESFYAGTGAGQPLGILNAPCLVTQAAEAGQAAATIVSENVINMYARRWVGATDYVWMINQSVTPQLLQMNLGVGTGGALTYMPPGGLSGSPYGSLFGLPVIEIEQARTRGTVGDIALCAWSQYQAIEKGGIQGASSMHVRFIYDEMTYRFVYRVDGQPEARWPLPLTPFQGGANDTQGPFVVLATRS
jgi:HK97 family phage major capsid protein